MQPEDIVLAIVSADDNGVPGRTYLQKVAYFVGEELRSDLGFQPHYYGPYSRTVSAARAALVDRGVLAETMSVFPPSSPGDFETRRYSYRVAKDAEPYVTHVQSEEAKLFSDVTKTVTAIREADADYRQLSCAAKVHYVLKTREEAMTPLRIGDECAKLGWELREEDIERAVGVLEHLHLLESE